MHTVRLYFTTFAWTCAFWGFPDSGPNYTFKIIKMVAHSKVALLINRFAATAAAERYKHPCNTYRVHDIQTYHA